MADLTDDELAVLMIAEKGESMMPIGRWEMPIRNLAIKGYMRANDSVNYVITDAGREACKNDDDESMRQLLEVGGKVASGRQQAQHSVEQAAIHLSHAAQATARVTGRRPEDEARQWHEQVLRRCMELLNG